MKESYSIEQYADMLDLPHHTSMHHPRMGMLERAAQFSPFAALKGYGDAVEETRRLTQKKIDLTEAEKELLDEKLQEILSSHAAVEEAEAEITYFVPDEKKEGGEYVTITGKIRKIDPVTRAIVLEDRSRIPVGDILDIGRPER